MTIEATGLGGARFFDEKKRDRGWASRVVKRAPAAGNLTALDVSTTDAALASFLRGLDRTSIRVQSPEAPGGSYSFRWASGYDNGVEIRVQGVLE